MMNAAGISTFRELAALSEVSASTIYGAISMDRRLSEWTARRLAKALGVTAEEVDPCYYSGYKCREQSEEEKRRRKRLAAKARGKTICWTCQNAVPDAKHGCSWSERFEPVKYWRADVTDNGFRVRSCPEYVPDAEGRDAKRV